jgi:hypothetical protein
MGFRGSGKVGRMRTTYPSPPRTRRGGLLGSELERHRLEQRAARVRQVIGALRERAETREEGQGKAPRPLTAAIEDFGRELAQLERRLREVAR